MSRKRKKIEHAGPGRPAVLEDASKVVVRFEHKQLQKLERLVRRRKATGRNAVLRDLVDEAKE